MAKPKKVLKSKSKKTLVIGSKAQLIITTSRHNIYATLVQIEQPKKVIFTLSGGQVKEVEKSVNKRFKTSPGTVINLAQKIYEETLLLGIFTVDIILKVSMRFVIKSLIYNLKLQGLGVDQVVFSIPYVFNGVRKKKLRRV